MMLEQQDKNTFSYFKLLKIINILIYYRKRHANNFFGSQTLEKITIEKGQNSREKKKNKNKKK